MVASLIAGERRLDGEFVLERARRAIGGFERVGLREGDVIAIMLRNDVAFFEAMLAARLGGFYACPVNWHFKAEEAGHILRDSGAKALVAHADLLPGIEGAVPDGTHVIAVEPSAPLRDAFRIMPEQCRVAGVPEWESWLAASPAYAGPPRAPRTSMPYSSGTTGRPKGIRRGPLTPEHVALMAQVSRIAFGIEPGMRTASVAPLYHSAPALHAVQSLLAGDLIVIHPRFDGERLLADIERHRLTQLYLVPTLYVRLLRLPEDVKRRYDLSSLKFVASTGSPCPPEVKRAMIEWWGPIVTETYASSEGGLITWCSAEDALKKPGTAGRPLPGAVVRILDDDGNELPPGEVGVIYTKQAAYPDFTYINNDAARRELERDGLITVGDMGFVDADGYLFLRDRRSDMVISGGVNIYPAEIEAALLQMPGVMDCAVFGIPDPEFGEALAAHVQPRPGAALDAESVRAFLRERLAGYKVPRVVAFAEELPREETGKVFKRKLREPYWRDAGRRI